MSCQLFTSTNHGRTYKGTNLRVVASEDSCANLGYTRVLIADCWEDGNAPPAPFNGWCLHNNETYTIQADSTCTKCVTSANEKCDCLNGGCIPSRTYNTPGKFANLANCQSACAKDSPCTGECVPIEEIAALQQAAGNLRSRLCK